MTEEDQREHLCVECLWDNVALFIIGIVLGYFTAHLLSAWAAGRFP